MALKRLLSHNKEGLKENPTVSDNEGRRLEEERSRSMHCRHNGRILGVGMREEVDFKVFSWFSA